MVLGAATGAIGRWGYGVALVLLLMTVPLLVLKTLSFGLTMTFRLAPILLVGLGIYLLLKAFK